jgi:hypothetical protein
MKAKTHCEIEQLKHKRAPFMNERALKYLDAVDNAGQYPGARIDVDFWPYHHVSAFNFIDRGINESSKQSS